MPLALTGGQMLAIGLVAAVFIAFALASSFLLPRRDPDFPGRRLPLFVAVSVALFVAMMAAMVVFAKEEEAEQHAAEPAAETHTETGAATETAGGAAAAQGDPEAGRNVFAEAGCGGCHVLEEAGSSGQAGPSLDESQLSHEQVVEQVREGGGGMPAFEGRLTDKQIQDVAAFVVEASAGS